jgi:hypothetical protein
MKVGFVSSDENAALQVDHLSCHPESKHVSIKTGDNSHFGENKTFQ